MFAAFYFGFVRNTQVLNFRKSVINQITTDNQAEIQKFYDNPTATVPGVQAQGDQLLARYRILDNPSYNEMVLKFWKPLNVKTWYPNETYLKDY